MAMTEGKKIAIEAIEDKKQVFSDLSDKIWEYAELSLLEYKSRDEYVKVLKELGFEVETDVCGIKTAFLGKYGSGRPVYSGTPIISRFS